MSTDIGDYVEISSLRAKMPHLAVKNKNELRGTKGELMQVMHLKRPQKRLSLKREFNNIPCIHSTRLKVYFSRASGYMVTPLQKVFLDQLSNRTLKKNPEYLVKLSL